ncbi:MAG: outer membrane protein assembly factor BamD (BamD/ComL family), partial [Roseivirga sp.]
SQPQNLNYVKNSFQSVLTEPEDLDTLQTILYDNIQEDAGNPIYNELLVWTHLQQKDFSAALRQARALDRRLQNNAENILNVGLIAFRNNDFKSATKAFDYIINEFKDSPNYNLSKKYVLLSEEEVIKQTYPVSKEAVVALIAKYDEYKSTSRDIFTIMDSERRIALLYAFQLNEIPISIQILKEIIAKPVGKQRIIAESKMDLADIYLLNEEPWESILLYAQVERMFKDEPLGYEAKLKSAKLSYFKGEFELAQSHLDILKLATSREIANDALNLSILIKNNTVFDSTDVVMQAYANIELMLFQSNKSEAIKALDLMLEMYPKHSIVDEVYFLKARTQRELGLFSDALASLEKINVGYYFEILGDDSLFLTGIILEEDIKDGEKAMQVYLDLLNKFKGSIYVSEARKRLRELRGDFG